MPPTTPSERDPLYGWVMVAVVFLLAALAFGGANAVGVFLKPVAADFGWSRGETSFGYTSAAIAVAVGGLVWGIVADRFGTTWLAIMGALAMACALFSMSHIEALWQFYVLYLLYGFFGHSPLGGPLYANVGFWFKRHKGLAIGIMTAGGMAGSALVPLLARHLMGEGNDWRHAYQVLAAVYLTIALPLALMIRESPARRQVRGATPARDIPGESPLSPRETMAWISAATLFCCICMSVAIVHLVPVITDRGIAPETGAGVLTAMMLAGVIGRISAGKLCDSFGALRAYTLNALGQTVLVFWFPHVTGLAATFALAIVFGFFFSGVMASILVCVRVMVPARMAARAMGVMGLLAWTGMGLGGWLAGLLHDATGAYAIPFAVASLSGIINQGILAGFRQRLRNPTRPAVIGAP